MYFILGLPRSRTTWLSVFLSRGAGICHHEKSMYFGSLQELKQFCIEHPKEGISDTALIQHWKWLRDNLPDAKIVVIVRDPDECAASLEHIGLPAESLGYLQDCLFGALHDPHIMRINFSDLNKIEYCKMLYEYCKEEDFDLQWYEAIKDINMQPDNAALLNEVNKNIHNIDALYGRNNQCLAQINLALAKTPERIG